MYLLYAGSNTAKAAFLEKVLYSVDKSKTLLAVPNGYELLSFLQKVKKGESYPALIILETDMPRLSGRETLQFLKTDDLYRLIPVVVFSSTVDMEDMQYYTNLGAECIPKPLTAATWNTVVMQMCNACHA